MSRDSGQEPRATQTRTTTMPERYTINSKLVFAGQTVPYVESEYVRADKVAELETHLVLKDDRIVNQSNRIAELEADLATANETITKADEKNFWLEMQNAELRMGTCGECNMYERGFCASQRSDLEAQIAALTEEKTDE